MNVEYSNQAKKFLKKLNNKLVLRIFEVIESLSNNPYPSDVKRV